MTAPRLVRLLLDALIVVAAAASLHVWLIGPIEIAPRLRPIHWDRPARPLMLALALLAVRLAVPAVGWAWRRLGPRLGPVLLSPWVWAPVLALAVAAWPYARHRAWREAVASAAAARASGAVQIGLTTRPVLSDAEVIDGFALPPGAAGRTVQIACGLADEASGASVEAPAPGRILTGPAGAGRAARTEVGSCPIVPGVWSETRVTLPENLPPGSSLLLSVEQVPEARRPLVHWSRPRLLPPPDPARPNLIVISLDTLRADHLGAYGYGRPVSPGIDRFARGGALFERAYAQAPWTTPSHMSLFTSMFPSVHAVDSPTSIRQRRLGEDRIVLAEVLGDAGYVTGAFTGSGSISAVYGFWRGFDLYHETDKDDPGRRGEDISGVFDAASAWLVTHHQLPFFMFFHSYEVHAPFVHGTFLGTLTPAQGADEAQRLTALYDGDILYADGFVTQLLSLVESLGIAGRTIVVLTSDHGEELSPRYPGERLGHGHTVYDDLLHVPLIVAAPGRVPAGLRHSGAVQIIDIMPTVLEMMGIPPPAGIQGATFAGLFRGETLAERQTFAEATNYGPERKTVRAGRYKYVRLFPREERPARDIPVPVPEEEFFDLAVDPMERASLVASGGPELERLRGHLDALVRLNLTLRSARPAEELDEETIRRLKALGYVK